MLIGLIVGLLVALFLVGHGVAVIGGGGAGYSSVLERAAFGFIQVLSGIAIIFGLLGELRAPLVRAGIVMTGVVIISVMWYWAAMITVPLGVALATVAYLRDRRSDLSNST
jgi:hypothetical protein